MEPYSVIVVARDQPRLLLSMLLHLRTHARPDEVLIIDNASDSNLSSVVALTQLPARIVRLEDHVSLGAAINTGLDKAQHDRVLLLHNDAIVMGDPIIAIDYLTHHPDVGIVGAKLFMPGEEPRKVRLVGYKVDDHRLRPREIGREQWDTFRETVNVAATSTACMALRRTDLRFDERYWFDLEDVDFGLQHLQRGLRVVTHPDLHAVHLEQGGVQEHMTRHEWGVLAMVSRLLYHERWCSSQPIQEHPLQHALRGEAAASYRIAHIKSVIGAPIQDSANGWPGADQKPESEVSIDPRLAVSAVGERAHQ